MVSNPSFTVFRGDRSNEMQLAIIICNTASYLGKLFGVLQLSVLLKGKKVTSNKAFDVFVNLHLILILYHYIIIDFCLSNKRKQSHLLRFYVI